MFNALNDDEPPKESTSRKESIPTSFVTSPRDRTPPPASSGTKRDQKHNFREEPMKENI